VELEILAEDGPAFGFDFESGEGGGGMRREKVVARIFAGSIGFAMVPVGKLFELQGGSGLKCRWARILDSIMVCLLRMKIGLVP
jgi:hypothetical protein